MFPIGMTFAPGLTPEDGKVAGQIQIGSSDMAAHAPASPAAAAREAPAAYRHPVYGTEFLTLAGGGSSEGGKLEVECLPNWLAFAWTDRT